MVARHALVTGGGSGIGRAAAIALSSAGYQCAIVGRSRAKLEATAAAACAFPISNVRGESRRSPSPGRGARWSSTPTCGAMRTCSASRTRQRRPLAVRPSHRWPRPSSYRPSPGRLDVLVNCAGAAPRVAVESTRPAAMRDCLELNTVAAATLIVRLWPALLAAKGCVLNVSSLAAVDPFPGFLAYGAAKAALESLTRSVRVEGADQGIRAFTLRCGRPAPALPCVPASPSSGHGNQARRRRDVHAPLPLRRKGLPARPRSAVRESQGVEPLSSSRSWDFPGSFLRVFFFFFFDRTRSRPRSSPSSAGTATLTTARPLPSSNGQRTEGR